MAEERELIVELSGQNLYEIVDRDFKKNDIAMRLKFDLHPQNAQYEYRYAIRSKEDFSFEEEGRVHQTGYVFDGIRVFPDVHRIILHSGEPFLFEDWLEGLVSNIENNNEGVKVVFKGLEHALSAYQEVTELRKAMGIEHEENPRKNRCFREYMEKGAKGMDRRDILYLIGEGTHDMERLIEAKESFTNVDSYVKHLNEVSEKAKVDERDEKVRRLKEKAGPGPIK
jgi:hypothetical protein